MLATEEAKAAKMITASEIEEKCNELEGIAGCLMLAYDAVGHDGLHTSGEMQSALLSMAQTVQRLSAEIVELAYKIGKHESESAA